MPEYVFKERMEHKCEVKPCPCCGSNDLAYSNTNEDISMHREWALVRCNNCGHEVRIDATWQFNFNGSGLRCQLATIQKWNNQYDSYLKPVVELYKCESLNLSMLKVILAGYEEMSNTLFNCDFVKTLLNDEKFILENPECSPDKIHYGIEMLRTRIIETEKLLEELKKCQELHL